MFKKALVFVLATVCTITTVSSEPLSSDPLVVLSKEGDDEKKVEKIFHYITSHFEKNFLHIYKGVGKILKHKNIWDEDQKHFKKHPKLLNDIKHFGIEFSYHVLSDLERLGNSLKKDEAHQMHLIKKREMMEKKHKLSGKQDAHMIQDVLKFQLNSIFQQIQKLRNIHETLRSMNVKAKSLIKELGAEAKKDPALKHDLKKYVHEIQQFEGLANKVNVVEDKHHWKADSVKKLHHFHHSPAKRDALFKQMKQILMKMYKDADSIAKIDTKKKHDLDKKLMAIKDMRIRHMPKKHLKRGRK